MINVTEAIEIISRNAPSFGTVSIPLHQSIGRILEEELVAGRDFPPYDRITMDGIAINYAAFHAGKRSFPIQGIAAAGAPQMTLETSDHCLEVMTGAIMPKQADTVIRYEDLTLEDGQAILNVDTIREGQNVHYKGEDRKAGSLVVAKKTKISPAEIGVAATVGKSNLLVARLPKTIIISTGDELVEIDKQPLAHQIRRSNVHRLKTSLSQWNIQADTTHLNDDLEVIKKELKTILEDYELIILSGGVSKGKFDFIPEALASLGVEKLFHKVKQRPGKPFWFGKAANGNIVFALPGNPVSSFVCTQFYLRNWLNTSLCIKNKTAFGILKTDVHFKPDLTYFMQVKTSFDEQGRIIAQPVEGHGSGDLANLVDADAFLILPQGQNVFESGNAYPLFFYRKVV